MAGGRPSFAAILRVWKAVMPSMTAATKTPAHWPDSSPKYFPVLSKGNSAEVMRIRPGRHHHRLNHLSRFIHSIHSRPIEGASPMAFWIVSTSLLTRSSSCFMHYLPLSFFNNLNSLSIRRQPCQTAFLLSPLGFIKGFGERLTFALAVP